MRRPVQRSEKRARCDGVADHRADAALVAVALGDDRRAQPPRQGVHLEVRRGPLDFVDQAEHVSDSEAVQPSGERTARASRPVERGQHPIERSALTEEQQLVLAAEIMIQIGGGQFRGARDVAHAGGGEADVPEGSRGGAQDVDPARVGASFAKRAGRTAVRKVNHRSILSERTPDGRIAGWGHVAGAGGAAKSPPGNSSKPPAAVPVFTGKSP